MRSAVNDELEGKSFHWLLEAAVDAMLIAGAGGSIVHVNPAAERLFGYNRDDFSRLTVEDLIPQRFRANHQAIRADYFEHPKSRTMGGAGIDIFALRKNGGEFAADVSLSQIGNGLVLVTVYDITRRKQAEESLAAARAFAQSIVDTLQEPLVVLDADFRVVSANPAFYAVFRLSPEATERQRILDLHERKWDTPALRRLLCEISNTAGGIEAFELRIEVPGAGSRTLSINARKILRTARQQELILLAILDITERKRLEEEQTHAIHDLECANEELKNFAYVVSHDLKAPLRGIGSLADWIAADQKDRLDADGQEHLRLLIQRVRRMDALIDGVLKYSRIGRVHEAAVVVNLKELLHEVIDSLAPPAHITITVTETLPTIRTQRILIQQVFQNLLANAIRFSDKPCGQIRIDCTEQGELWKFSVIDNGPGIEARHFERIFQLFQTLNPRDRVESTGVGLSIVKKIVEQLGGRVGVESSVGQGSTFYFVLPKTIPEQ